MRFSLFDYDGGEAMAHTLFFDFDGVDFSYASAIGDLIEEVVTEKYGFHVVYTGGGFHVYIPLAHPFNNDDRLCAIQSYHETVKMMEATATFPVSSFDTGVFNSCEKYGRVPSSVNSKNNVVVEYCYFSEGPRPQGIFDVLEKRDAPPRKEVPRPQNLHDSSAYNPAKFCAFIGWVDHNVEKVSHDLGVMAYAILASAKQKIAARNIAIKHRDFKEEAFEEMFKSSEKYKYSCASVKNACGERGVSPCNGCPHDETGSFPAYVSGTLPTPSASRGFHSLKAVKVDGKEVQTINDKMVELTDVANYWTNTAEGAIKEQVVYRWDETYWKRVFLLTERPVTLSSKLTKEVAAIPSRGFQTAPQYDAFYKKVFPYVAAHLPPLNSDIDTNQINLINGIYDLKKGALIPHNKEFGHTHKPIILYDDKATCPKWEAFLDEATANKEIKDMIQIFFGLAVSAIPLHEYQEMLWIQGAPQTGKSTIAEVMHYMVGKDNSFVVGGHNTPMLREGVRADFVQKKFQWIDDYKPQKGVDWEPYLLAFIGGAIMQFRPLWADPIEARADATTIITSNHPPPIYTKTSGLNRRVRLVRMDKKFPKKDPTFLQAYKDEAPGIFNWALEGLRRYREEGMPPRSKEEDVLIALVHDERQSALDRFYDKYLKAEENGKESSADLYEKFIAHTGTERGKYPYSKFIKYISENLPPRLGLSPGDIFTTDDHDDGVIIHGISYVPGSNAIDGEETK